MNLRSISHWVALLFSLSHAILGQAAQPQAQPQAPAGPGDALFDPGRILQVEIQMDPNDWHELRIGYRTLVGVNQLSTTEKPYPYYHADVMVDGRKVSSVGVRKKGSLGSMVSSRPSLKLKFDEYIKGRDFSGLEMMTLNNDVQDATHTCQFLTYAYMRKAGVPAPRCSLAHVRVNGEDLGIYSHVESIDKRFIKRHFTNARGTLYEGQNGGDFTTNLFPRILHKWGEDKERVLLGQFAALLNDPVPLTLQSLEPWLDVAAFIRVWVAEMMIGNRDGYAWAGNNYYLYRDATSGRLNFVPWGRDTAFAPQGDWWGTSVPKSVVAFGLVCERLWELPEIRERYRRELARQLAEVWNEDWLRAELGRLKKLCSDTGKLDEAESNPGYQRIEEYVGRRRSEVEAESRTPFPELPRRPRGGRRPPDTADKPLMQIDGAFSAIISASPPTNRSGLGTGSVQYSVQGNSLAPFSRYSVVAYPSKADYRDFITIELDALDAAGQLRWRVYFAVDPYRVRPGLQKLAPLVAFCRVTQGDPAVQTSQSRGSYNGLTGTIAFEQASTNLGGTIAGKFSITTSAFDEENRP